MFQIQDIDEMTQVFTEELNMAAKKLITVKRVQKKRFHLKFWTKKLTALKCQIDYWLIRLGLKNLLLTPI